MPKKKTASFEADLERLAEIVALLEEGPETLAEMLALYEEGVAIAGRLEQTLAEAETKVRELAREAGGGLADDEAEAE
jgi:exodeoxyribonuclease VII small subunit